MNAGNAKSVGVICCLTGNVLCGCYQAVFWYPSFFPQCEWTTVLLKLKYQRAIKCQKAEVPESTRVQSWNTCRKNLSSCSASLCWSQFVKNMQRYWTWTNLWPLRGSEHEYRRSPQQAAAAVWLLVDESIEIWVSKFVCSCSRHCFLNEWECKLRC